MGGVEIHLTSKACTIDNVLEAIHPDFLKRLRYGFATFPGAPTRELCWIEDQGMISFMDDHGVTAAFPSAEFE